MGMVFDEVKRAAEGQARRTEATMLDAARRAEEQARRADAMMLENAGPAEKQVRMTQAATEARRRGAEEQARRIATSPRKPDGLYTKYPTDTTRTQPRSIRFLDAHFGNPILCTIQ